MRDEQKSTEPKPAAGAQAFAFDGWSFVPIENVERAPPPPAEPSRSELERA